MPLETNPQYIGQLNADWPNGELGDTVSTGDNQIRNVKKATQGSFPNLGNQPVTATAAQLNAAALSSGQYATGTSTTSLLIGTGTKSFTTQAGRGFGVGQKIRLTSQANVNNYMQGLCSAYDTVTGAMSVLVDTIGGSGTFADWSVVVYVADSVMQLPRSGRTSNVQLTAADSGYLIDITSGTFTQTVDAANLLGPKWFVYLSNSGSGAVTYAGTAYATGSMVLLQGDGSVIRSYVIRVGEQVLYVRDEKPSGSNGGTSTSGVWSQRDLNTTALNTISGASVTGNTVILPAGVYDVDASAPCFNGAAHQVRIYDVTNSAVLAVGENSSSSTSVMTRSRVKRRITLVGTTTIRLEHYITSGVTVNGFGTSVGGGMSQIYSELEARKIL